VSALHIASLGLDVAVVPTSWEPPPFIVGQLKGSANITEGNTVLVGHLTGAAGAVFNRLDDLSPGDRIVAVSRGLEYDFVVSDKQVLPNADTSLALPNDQAMLTLMTCTGTWDPIAHDYSGRLWVTAELPDAAAAAIAANALHPRAPTPIPEGAAPAVDPDAVLAQAGLGAMRGTFDATLGAPLGETPGKLVVYRRGSNEYHVEFTPDPPRAELIDILAMGPDTSLSIPTAVVRSRSAFPSDATPRTAAPEQVANTIVERFWSAAVAETLGQPIRGGQAGDFVAVYARDARGEVTHVVVGSGDDPAGALNDALRTTR
jgi:LPXTG-site transpeptidase (sortase) family protein